MAYIPCNSGGGSGVFPNIGKAHIVETPSNATSGSYSVKNLPSFTMSMSGGNGCGCAVINTDGYTNISTSRAILIVELDADGNLIATHASGSYTLNANTNYVIVVDNVANYPGTTQVCTITLS